MEGGISIDCTPDPLSRKMAIRDRARAETKLTSNETAQTPKFFMIRAMRTSPGKSLST